MEASIAFHRCARQALSRSGCRGFELTRTTSTSNSARQHLNLTRTSLRAFSSTRPTLETHTPNTRSRSISNTTPPSNQSTSTTTPPSSADGLIKPNPNTRIDLSSITTPSQSHSQPQSRRLPGYDPNFIPGAAQQKISALFQRQQAEKANRFTKTIRQTDALNRPVSPVQSDNTTFNADPNNFTSSIGGTRSTPFQVKSFLDEIAPPKKRTSEPMRLPLRLRPTLGRSIQINFAKGVDVTRAFGQLERKCAANNVRKDANNQRFHVRRGQKRKLDRSARWRVQFRAGFLEECKRVRRMKNQGW